MVTECQKLRAELDEAKTMIIDLKSLLETKEKQEQLSVASIKISEKRSTLDMVPNTPNTN
jgi:hypothetical protein